METEAKILDYFANLLSEMSEKLIEMNVNMKRFHSHVVRLFPPGDCIPASSDPEDIFDALVKNGLMNHLHYDPPLESVAQRFGTSSDSSMMALVREYNKKLTAFTATTKLADYISKCETEDEADPDESILPNPAKYDKAYFKKLRVKLQIRITDETLKYIDDLWRSLAEHFLLPSLSALLDSVLASSLIIVWLVPDQIVQQILERISGASEFFRRHHITEVFIDDECVYKDMEEHEIVS